MPETILLSATAWLLFAGASFRFRREAGTTGRGDVRLLRVVATALLAVALLHCGAPLTGERWVRLLTGASIGAVLVVLALSAQPLLAIAPARWLLLAKRRAVASVRAILRPQTPANG
jgi:hypothetical protein